MKANYTLRVSSRQKLLLLVSLMFFLVTGLQAQVTIGDGVAPQKFSILEIVSNSKGGMRLPQLTTVERDGITDAAFKANPLAEGLSIFNTSTKCYEYWNGGRWVSLCKGDASIIFKDNGGTIVDPFFPPFDSDGETRGAFTTHDSEPCVGMPTAFDFLVMIGSSYTSFDVTDPTTGEFKLTMNPNPTARSRTAVLRITNNCTSEYKEFLFIQKGSTSVCQGTVVKPIVLVSNSGAMCSTGAVYMSIDPSSVNATANYIWTLNDSPLDDYTGKTYCPATQSGTYKVYVGGVGCDINASDNIPITLNSSGTAPAAVGSITASNSGVICSTADVKLTAYNVPSGASTLTWYKDGQKTSKTGNPISVASGEEGDWFAIMEDGTCTSKPSNIISVTYDNTSTPLVDPQITVNGVALASASFCKGGHTTLELSNAASYINAITVSWYNGTTLLGTGIKLSITAPTTGDLLLRCVVHDNTGVSCDAEVISTKTVTGTAPSRPSISGNPFICGGSPALLSAPSGAHGYIWYKDGSEITSAITSNYSATQAGNYQVQVVDAGGCKSSLSATASVQVSAFPTVAFVLPLDEAEPSSIVTYQVSASQNPASYVWTIDGGAVLLDGDNPNTQSSTTTGSSIRVQMGASNETISLTCSGVNNCGNSPVISHSIDVKPACTPVSIGNVTMSPTGNILVGTSVSMSVTATGSAPFSYVWKRDGAPIAGAPDSPTYSFTATNADDGTYSVDVSNCGGTVTAMAKTIHVFDTNTITGGLGKLIGPDCFDVNQSNWNATCGLEAQRQTADFTKTYTYTFSNKGVGNSDLTWMIDENPVAAIIDYSQSTINDVSGTLTDGGMYTITVKFKESLMVDAKGTTDANAYKANIYAIYKRGANYEKQLLEVTIKDCNCGCGAMTTSGTWLRFMCHNLGADENLDPFTPNAGLYGDLYQWGRPKDGHQLRTSATVTNILATNNDATTPTTVNGKFIIIPGSPYDWRSGAGNTARWGNGTTDVNPPKAANDPCPTGWKVPSQAQWQSIFKASGTGAPSAATANTWTWTSSGYKVGDALFLPAAGYRNVTSGGAVSVGSLGYYWSSTADGTNSYNLNFYNGYVLPAYNYYRGSGFSVRCVQE